MSKSRLPGTVLVVFVIHALMQQAILEWYRDNARDLPWRRSQNPYWIWISEIMLQQTTVAAVIPYFLRFIDAFPSVQDLATASIEDVYKLWSGLGYYSRARNIHAAAQRFASEGFPESYKDLLDFPGLGPYTARAVASIAFNENVGVLDGNVIRVLSRLHAQSVEHWKPQGRNHLQSLADAWVLGVESREMNQALMELGATICLPQSPKCLICPLRTSCVAFQSQAVDEFPKLKPRRKSEIWLWEIEPSMKNRKVGLIKNDYAPFLKGQWIWPGRVKRLTRIPKKFDYQHTVTHHKIYVSIQATAAPKQNEALNWIKVSEISHVAPTSLVQKALPFLHQSSIVVK